MLQSPLTPDTSCRCPGCWFLLGPIALQRPLCPQTTALCASFCWCHIAQAVLKLEAVLLPRYSQR